MSVRDNIGFGLRMTGHANDDIASRTGKVSSKGPGVRIPVSGAICGAAERWREHIEAEGAILARFDDGAPAIAAKDKRLYVAFWPDAEALASLMDHATRRAGLDTHRLPEPIRIRRRGDLLFVFNYGREAWRAPAFAAEPVIGGCDVPALGYSVLRMDARA
jgi:beta-galactosidase